MAGACVARRARHPGRPGSGHTAPPLDTPCPCACGPRGWGGANDSGRVAHLHLSAPPDRPHPTRVAPAPVCDDQRKCAGNGRGIRTPQLHGDRHQRALRHRVISLDCTRYLAASQTEPQCPSAEPLVLRSGGAGALRRIGLRRNHGLRLDTAIVRLHSTRTHSSQYSWLYHPGDHRHDA